MIGLNLTRPAAREVIQLLATLREVHGDDDAKILKKLETKLRQAAEQEKAA